MRNYDYKYDKPDYIIENNYKYADKNIKIIENNLIIEKNIKNINKEYLLKDDNTNLSDILSAINYDNRFIIPLKNTFLSVYFESASKAILLISLKSAWLKMILAPILSSTL